MGEGVAAGHDVGGSAAREDLLGGGCIEVAGDDVQALLPAEFGDVLRDVDADRLNPLRTERPEQDPVVAAELDHPLRMEAIVEPDCVVLEVLHERCDGAG